MKRRVGAVFSPFELILIRHGRTTSTTRLCGRTDVALGDAQPTIAPKVLKALQGVKTVITSPALRCTQTAELIWGQGARTSDVRLWEQDFGAWENQLFSDLPDIGDLDQAALAQHRPPNGESFQDVVTRTKPAIKEAAQATGAHPVALVVHAGVIRAALGLALDAPQKGLGFEIAHFSLTRLRCLPDGKFSIIATNWDPT